jgi:hypothetical protein
MQAIHALLEKQIDALELENDALVAAVGRGRGGTGGHKETPCRFGRGCTRKGCWFAHPEGRKMVNDMLATPKKGDFTQLTPQLAPHYPKALTLRRCPSDISKDKTAYATASEHIQLHHLEDRFVKFADRPAAWKQQPLGSRGLSLQFFEDFHEAFAINESFTFLTVLWLVQILTEKSGMSLAELMGSKMDKRGVPYQGDCNCFVSHATAHTSFCDYEALLAFSKKRRAVAGSTTSGGAADSAAAEGAGEAYFFIDVFAINQSNVRGDGELPMLERVIRDAKITLLIFDCWHCPEVVRRIWCLFEIIKSVQNGCVLAVSFSEDEKQSLLAALRNEHPEGLGPGSILGCIFKINAEQAEATKVEDKIRIGREIEDTVEGGFHGLNMAVKKSLRASLVAEVLAEAEAEENQRDSKLLYGVGKFFYDMGGYDRALDFYGRCLRVQVQSTVLYDRPSRSYILAVCLPFDQLILFSLTRSRSHTLAHTLSLVRSQSAARKASRPAIQSAA